MAKPKTIDLTSDIDTVSGLMPASERGPVAPVRRGERIRYLRDGQWVPSWLVWLRRRKRVALALLALAGAAWAAWRLFFGARR